MAKRTDVKKCSCQHMFQDKYYGKGERLHTLRTNGKYVCTVCGRER